MIFEKIKLHPGIPGNINLREMRNPTPNIRKVTSSFSTLRKTSLLPINKKSFVYNFLSKNDKNFILTNS